MAPRLQAWGAVDDAEPNPHLTPRTSYGRFLRRSGQSSAVLLLVSLGLELGGAAGGMLGLDVRLDRLLVGIVTVLVCGATIALAVLVLRLGGASYTLWLKGLLWLWVVGRCASFLSLHTLIQGDQVATQAEYRLDRGVGDVLFWSGLCCRHALYVYLGCVTARRYARADAFTRAEHIYLDLSCRGSLAVAPSGVMDAGLFLNS